MAFAFCFAQGLQRSSYTSSGISRGKERHSPFPNLSSYLPHSFCTWLIALRAELAWLRDCLQNQCCQIVVTRVVVSAWAGISLPLRCMGLILQVRGDNNSNASPSGSRNLPGSNIKLATSVKKPIQRKVFASARSQDLPWESTSQIASSTGCGHPRKTKLPKQCKCSTATLKIFQHRRIIFQLWEAASRETALQLFEFLQLYFEYGNLFTAISLPSYMKIHW